MRKILKPVAWVAAGLLALIVVVVGAGALLPVDHVATVSAVYEQPIGDVWVAINDFGSFPRWRTGIERVESRTYDDGAEGWVEHGTDGAIPLAVVSSEPPHRLELRIATDQLPFGGTWTYELATADDGETGTQLTITEHGSVTNPLFRFVSRFILGHTVTMENYLIDLGAMFGETTQPSVRVD